MNHVDRLQAAEQRRWAKQQEREEREHRKQRIASTPENELTPDDRRFAFDHGIDVGSDRSRAELVAIARCTRPGLDSVQLFELFPFDE